MPPRRFTVAALAIMVVVACQAVPAWSEIPHNGGAAEEERPLIGVALDVLGRPLVNAGVRLRRVSAPVDSVPVAVAMTDEQGRFSVTFPGEGRYVIDILVGSVVVATSAPVGPGEPERLLEIRAGPPRETRTKEGKGVLFWTAVGAGIGAGTGLIMNATNPDCRSPDSLCPLVPVSLAITGGLMGFLFGFGR
jgi:hypothetical protein